MSEEFLRLQFQALRDEILATQRRDFQVIGIGLLVVPAVNHFTPPLAAPVVLAMPAVAIVIVLVHIAQESSVLRCAAYIRECIEPVLGSLSMECNHPPGWETWLVRLERAENRKTPDWYMRLGVNVLLLAYLAITLWYAADYVIGQAEWKVFGGALLAAYAGVAITLVRHIFAAAMQRRDMSAVHEPESVEESTLRNHVASARLRLRGAPQSVTSDSAVDNVAAVVRQSP